MCTAATYRTKDFYFGRTLDYEFSYGEEIVITPRNYEFNFQHMGQAKEYYAIIGMAHVAGDYPLYYDAINEKGIGMAGLNFVGNAVYAEVTEGKENVASFEFIPWVLRQCATMDEVRALLAKINLVGTPFAEQFPASQLHWIIADENEAITVESVAALTFTMPMSPEVMPAAVRALIISSPAVLPAASLSVEKVASASTLAGEST